MVSSPSQRKPPSVKEMLIDVENVSGVAADLRAKLLAHERVVIEMSEQREEELRSKDTTIEQLKEVLRSKNAEIEELKQQRAEAEKSRHEYAVQNENLKQDNESLRQQNAAKDEEIDNLLRENKDIEEVKQLMLNSSPTHAANKTEAQEPANSAELLFDAEEDQQKANTEEAVDTDVPDAATAQESTIEQNDVSEKEDVQMAGEVQPAQNDVNIQKEAEQEKANIEEAADTNILDATTAQESTIAQKDANEKEDIEMAEEEQPAPNDADIQKAVEEEKENADADADVDMKDVKANKDSEQVPETQKDEPEVSKEKTSANAKEYAIFCRIIEDSTYSNSVQELVRVGKHFEELSMCDEYGADARKKYAEKALHVMKLQLTKIIKPEEFAEAACAQAANLWRFFTPTLGDKECESFAMVSAEYNKKFDGFKRKSKALKKPVPDMIQQLMNVGLYHAGCEECPDILKEHLCEPQPIIIDEAMLQPPVEPSPVSSPSPSEKPEVNVNRCSDKKLPVDSPKASINPSKSPKKEETVSPSLEEERPPTSNDPTRTSSQPADGINVALESAFNTAGKPPDDSIDADSSEPSKPAEASDDKVDPPPAQEDENKSDPSSDPQQSPKEDDQKQSEEEPKKAEDAPDFAQMTAGKLKKWCTEQGVSIVGCLEKKDFLEAAQKAYASGEYGEKLLQQQQNARAEALAEAPKQPKATADPQPNPMLDEDFDLIAHAKMMMKFDGQLGGAECMDRNVWKSNYETNKKILRLQKDWKEHSLADCEEELTRNSRMLWRKYHPDMIFKLIKKDKKYDIPEIKSCHSVFDIAKDQVGRMLIHDPPAPVHLMMIAGGHGENSVEKIRLEWYYNLDKPKADGHSISFSISTVVSGNKWTDLQKIDGGSENVCDTFLDLVPEAHGPTVCGTVEMKGQKFRSYSYGVSATITTKWGKINSQRSEFPSNKIREHALNMDQARLYRAECEKNRKEYPHLVETNDPASHRSSESWQLDCYRRFHRISMPHRQHYNAAWPQQLQQQQHANAYNYYGYPQAYAGYYQQQQQHQQRAQYPQQPGVQNAYHPSQAAYNQQQVYQQATQAQQQARQAAQAQAQAKAQEDHQRKLKAAEEQKRLQQEKQKKAEEEKRRQHEQLLVQRKRQQKEAEERAREDRRKREDRERKRRREEEERKRENDRKRKREEEERDRKRRRSQEARASASTTHRQNSRVPSSSTGANKTTTNGQPADMVKPEPPTDLKLTLWGNPRRNEQKIRVSWTPSEGVNGGKTYDLVYIVMVCSSSTAGWEEVGQIPAVATDILQEHYPSVFECKDEQMENQVRVAVYARNGEGVSKPIERTLFVPRNRN